MAGPQFFETIMGKIFFESTMPNLVEQLKLLNKNLSAKDSEILAQYKSIVSDIRAALWLDTDGDAWFMNPEKEYNSDTADHIARILISRGLGPDKGHPGVTKEKP